MQIQPFHEIGIRGFEPFARLRSSGCCLVRPIVRRRRSFVRSFVGCSHNPLSRVNVMLVRESPQVKKPNLHSLCLTPAPAP